MSDWRLYLDLLGLSILASLIAAPVLGLTGALLHLRREAFLGVAVPQFATAGVACALWAIPFFPTVQATFLEHGHPPLLYLLPFAAGAAILALAAYGVRARARSAGAALAGGFALAGALTLAFLSSAPAGSNYAATLVTGEVLLLDLHHFEALVVAAVLGLAFLIGCRRPLLVGAVDPEQAFALGLPTRGMQRALPLVLGLVIGCGVMTVGPVLVFTLLFLPPLAATHLARGLRGYLACTLGVALFTVILAWPLALWGLPYGPAAGLIAGGAWLIAAVVGRLRTAR